MNELTDLYQEVDPESEVGRFLDEADPERSSDPGEMGGDRRLGSP